MGNLSNYFDIQTNVCSMKDQTSADSRYSIAQVERRGDIVLEFEA